MLMPPSVGTADLQSQSALAPTLLASRATSPNVEPAEREEAEIESESSDSQQEQGRNGDCIYFGWDFTPLLPYVLLCTTVLGGTGMFFIQSAIAGHQHLHPTSVDHGHIRNTVCYHLRVHDAGHET